MTYDYLQSGLLGYQAAYNPYAAMFGASPFAGSPFVPMSAPATYDGYSSSNSSLLYSYPGSFYPQHGLFSSSANDGWLPSQSVQYWGAQACFSPVFVPYTPAAESIPLFGGGSGDPVFSFKTNPDDKPKETIDDAAKKSAEKIKTGLGYTEAEAKSIVDEVKPGAGEDVDRLKTILHVDPTDSDAAAQRLPKRQITSANPADKADKEKIWCMRLAQWYARRVLKLEPSMITDFASDAVGDQDYYSRLDELMARMRGLKSKYEGLKAAKVREKEDAVSAAIAKLYDALGSDDSEKLDITYDAERGLVHIKVDEEDYYAIVAALRKKGADIGGALRMLPGETGIRINDRRSSFTPTVAAIKGVIDPMGRHESGIVVQEKADEVRRRFEEEQRKIEEAKKLPAIALIVEAAAALEAEAAAGEVTPAEEEAAAEADQKTDAAADGAAKLVVQAEATPDPEDDIIPGLDFLVRDAEQSEADATVEDVAARKGEVAAKKDAAEAAGEVVNAAAEVVVQGGVVQAKGGEVKEAKTEERAADVALGETGKGLKKALEDVPVKPPDVKKEGAVDALDAQLKAIVNAAKARVDALKAQEQVASAKSKPAVAKQLAAAQKKVATAEAVVTKASPFLIAAREALKRKREAREKKEKAEVARKAAETARRVAEERKKEAEKKRVAKEAELRAARERAAEAKRRKDAAAEEKRQRLEAQRQAREAAAKAKSAPPSVPQPAPPAAKPPAATTAQPPPPPPAFEAVIGSQITRVPTTLYDSAGKPVETVDFILPAAVKKEFEGDATLKADIIAAKKKYFKPAQKTELAKAIIRAIARWAIRYTQSGNNYETVNLPTRWSNPAKNPSSREWLSLTSLLARGKNDRAGDCTEHTAFFYSVLMHAKTTALKGVDFDVGFLDVLKSDEGHVALYVKLGGEGIGFDILNAGFKKKMGIDSDGVVDYPIGGSRFKSTPLDLKEYIAFMMLNRTSDFLKGVDEGAGRPVANLNVILAYLETVAKLGVAGRGRAVSASIARGLAQRYYKLACVYEKVSDKKELAKIFAGKARDFLILAQTNSEYYAKVFDQAIERKRTEITTRNPTATVIVPHSTARRELFEVHIKRLLERLSIYHGNLPNV